MVLAVVRLVDLQGPLQHVFLRPGVPQVAVGIAEVREGDGDLIVVLAVVRFLDLQGPLQQVFVPPSLPRLLKNCCFCCCIKSGPAAVVAASGTLVASAVIGAAASVAGTAGSGCDFPSATSANLFAILVAGARRRRGGWPRCDRRCGRV